MLFKLAEYDPALWAGIVKTVSNIIRSLTCAVVIAGMVAIIYNHHVSAHVETESENADDVE